MAAMLNMSVTHRKCLHTPIEDCVQIMSREMHFNPYSPVVAMLNKPYYPVVALLKKPYSPVVAMLKKPCSPVVAMLKSHILQLL